MARYVETNSYKRKQAVVEALEIFGEPAELDSFLSGTQEQDRCRDRLLLVFGRDTKSSGRSTWKFSSSHYQADRGQSPRDIIPNYLGLNLTAISILDTVSGTIRRVLEITM